MKITTSVAVDDFDPNMVKFRWESWVAGNGYVGPQAASDSLYVKKGLWKQKNAGNRI